MQTVWVLIGDGIMQAYSTEEKARSALGPTNGGLIRQLRVDEPRKKVTWVLKDELTDTDLMEYSDQEEAMDRCKAERDRFQVVKRES